MCASATRSSARRRAEAAMSDVLEPKTSPAHDSEVGGRRRLRARVPHPVRGRRRTERRNGRIARSDRLRAQRLHPHRRNRQDDIGHAADRDGTGCLHLDPDDPGRRAGCRLEQGRGGSGAAEREALRQSDARRAGDRQFQFHPRVLDAAAQGRRRFARTSCRGRREAMGRRSGELHDREWRGDAQGDQPFACLWRAGGSRRTARRPQIRR